MTPINKMKLKRCKEWKEKCFAVITCYLIWTSYYRFTTSQIVVAILSVSTLVVVQGIIVVFEMVAIGVVVVVVEDAGGKKTCQTGLFLWYETCLALHCLLK